ncbi:hypothetical protein D9V37_13090 [Nocardioides mangrovicus]|uniref:Uncharacterized protein n=1 Tax=Nocardioides mangrovicus TaxID=2478913 RepID=A0A3L8NZQ7_9ACTN|nr:hypothetical protein [Nocardioides mangrovicus]RLV48670.1 hypothetical protein D9V37_13090 [Nocardioides mangrovicus]
MDPIARRLAKVGGSMLIVAAFLVLILVLARHLTWFTLVALLVAMAVVLRLNIARVDRKFDRAPR